MSINYLRKKTGFIILVIGIFSGNFLYAQQDSDVSLKEAVDTTNRNVENLRTEFGLLKKLKISGYIQPQFQWADTAGAPTIAAGGPFPKNTDTRFAVRRGRIKVAYTGEFSQFVIQIDATERGVTLKDAYLSVTDPWLQTFTLTGGVFNRPFGYEIAYSSSLRESPERARITQTLFPGERDLGAMLTIQPRKESRYNFIKLDLGLIAGNGIAPEIDTRKDFLAHLTINRTTRNEKFKYGLGFSYYNGGYFQETKKVWDMATLADGMTQGYTVDSTETNKGAFAKREYFGAEAQFSVDWFPGITTLRGEYLWGMQPGKSNLNISPYNRNILDDDKGPYDTYNRPFSGGYVYLVQNIGMSRHSFVIKFDWFDPNTDVKGDELKSSVTIDENTVNTNLSVADVMYTTWGFGYNLRVTANVKLMAYYDLVKNETTGVKNYTKDVKDNVLTIRLQFKF
jgi:hypothetical protein